MILVVVFSIQGGFLWPVIAFVTLLLNRLMPLIGARRDKFEEKRAQHAGLFIIFSYFGCAVIAGFPIPMVPALGLTPEIADSLRVEQRAIVMMISFAALYFTAAAFSEIVGAAAAEKVLRAEMEAKRSWLKRPEHPR